MIFHKSVYTRHPTETSSFLMDAALWLVGAVKTATFNGFHRLWKENLDFFSETISNFGSKTVFETADLIHDPQSASWARVRPKKAGGSKKT